MFTVKPNLHIFRFIFSTNCVLVPRVLFDGWSYQDFESVFNSEDEIEDLVEAMVQTAKVRDVTFLR